ncbi:hypothetical protein [Microbacterium sp. T32]|uniref:hypothetical protein n=1 Tax=Microbacterium sp. T32 TaxID=1776083 RepID=UPI0007ABDB75|nr:hypothetical protein [Microbacterium sp. T32]KZE42043.1 hypothetical protein AVW09_10990 [Microbacterium sp. T32]
MEVTSGDEIARVVSAATLMPLTGLSRQSFDRHVRLRILLPSIDFKREATDSITQDVPPANGAVRYWELCDALRNVSIANIWRRLYRQTSVLHDFASVAVPDGDLEAATHRRMLLWTQKPGSRGALRTRADRQLAVVTDDGELLRTTETLLPLPGFSEGPAGLDADYETTPAEWLIELQSKSSLRNLDEIRRDPRLLRKRDDS